MPVTPLTVATQAHPSLFIVMVVAVSQAPLEWALSSRSCLQMPPVRASCSSDLGSPKPFHGDSGPHLSLSPQIEKLLQQAADKEKEPLTLLELTPIVIWNTDLNRFLKE